MRDYADLMNHPRYRLKSHRPMNEHSRAAQFSAFAALTGYDEELDETARLTTPREAMSEDDLAALDAAFRRLLELEPAHPNVTAIYFQPDARKEGGAYRTYTGEFRHYDLAAGTLRFADGKHILMQNICGLNFEENEA